MEIIIQLELKGEDYKTTIEDDSFHYHYKWGEEGYQQ